MDTTRTFSSPQEFKDRLGDQQYIASDEIATIMYLSQQLGKPLLTEGPAGVGKTRAIVDRVVNIATHPKNREVLSRLVVVTYTNKAADEMRRRVVALVGEDVYVSTFHSFCARLLRREISRIGREPSFTIYDRPEFESRRESVFLREVLAGPLVVLKAAL